MVAAAMVFRPITAKPSVHFVHELIDIVRGYWREDLTNEVFLPCNANIIQSIPLCTSWLCDKLV